MSFIKCLLKSVELIMPEDTAFPPCTDKSAAIAHELHEGGTYAHKSYSHAFVCAGRVDKDKQGVSDDWQPWCRAKPIPFVHIVIFHQHAPYCRNKHKGNNAYGEYSGKQVDGLERVGIFLIEVYAGYAAVVNLPEKLAEVGAALVPYPCVGEQAALASCLEYAYGEV